MRLSAVPVLIFSGLMLLSLYQSKSKIRIIHADFNLGRKVQNEQLRILRGSVHVVKDTVQMYCDSAYYYEQRISDNPKGPDEGIYRVLRGGSWRSSSWHNRFSAPRGKIYPDDRQYNIGFRVARDF